MMMMMVKCCVWFTIVYCSLRWQSVEGRKQLATSTKQTCEQLCSSLGIDAKNGCWFAPTAHPPEEVIVITNGTSDIRNWRWDTVTMVVSAYFSSARNTGLTACYTHLMGKRYGLREEMPSNISRLIVERDAVQKEFTAMIDAYHYLLRADHFVYDFVRFFTNLQVSKLDKSVALKNLAKVFKNVTAEVPAGMAKKGRVYCIVPWEPPCKSYCKDVASLLSTCDILVLSPDSYIPVASENNVCVASATVPLSHFLYGVDRYIDLRMQPIGTYSIIPGIPWHGYEYSCDTIDSENRCIISKPAGEACYDPVDDPKRRKQSLGDIHKMSYPQVEQKMDNINKGVYYNKDKTTQLWYENSSTLLIKYQLVKDLGFRGLSLWYGEDLKMGLSPEDSKFTLSSWDYMTHKVIHQAVFAPITADHHQANTVAGIGVGCLLLGTALGVIFTCIAFRRNRLRKLNQPFKLDEDEDAFRDDQGL